MNTPKLKRIEITRSVGTTSGILEQGTVFMAEMLSYGTNWIKVKLPSGRIKTLFNFEANWS